jgi:hypothetical protein
MTVRPPRRRVEISANCLRRPGSSSASTARVQTLPLRPSISAAGVPALTMRPSTRMAMREHRSATSSTMCVDRITTLVAPISASRLLNRLRSSGSRPAVGSSTIIRAGLPIIACAMPKR